jgi:hypothetical protein
MEALWVMTLPGLVLLLIAVAAVEVLVVRRRHKRGDQQARPKAAQAGFDALGVALAPSRRHTQEHDEFQELARDDEGDAAPPRSSVDLDGRSARIVLPPQD